MKRLVLVLAAVMAVVGIPAAALALPPSSQLQRDLDAVVAAGATGATAEVGSARVSSGAATLGTHRPVPVNGRFRIGSETKAFVATVVLQLVAEHRLGLDDTVDSRLPDVLPAGEGITVRELLNHTSGIPDILTTFPSPYSGAFVKMRWKTWSASDLVARVSAKPLLFPPGSKAGYSNTNYLLLGMLIERITGQPYGVAVRDRIIRPLGLRHTSVPGTDPYIRGPHAHGYLPLADDGSDRLVDITAFNPSLLGSAGEMLSTTRDLNRFFGALLGGRLLPPYLMKQMRTTAGDSIYGLGIIKRQLPCGVTVWGKDGDAPGYSTWSFTTPDTQRRVAVSVTWGAGDPDDAVDTLLDHALCP